MPVLAGVAASAEANLPLDDIMTCWGLIRSEETDHENRSVIWFRAASPELPRGHVRCQLYTFI